MLLPHKLLSSPQVTCKPCWRSVSCRPGSPLAPQEHRLDTDTQIALLVQGPEISRHLVNPMQGALPPKEEKLGPGHHMALSKARGLTLGGTPSPRHQRGAKRISQEALNT